MAHRDRSWLVGSRGLSRKRLEEAPTTRHLGASETYAGARLSDNWEALAHTLVLFRRVAVEVGEHLGYVYPYDLHQRVCAYVDQIRQLERPMKAQ